MPCLCCRPADHQPERSVVASAAWNGWLGGWLVWGRVKGTIMLQQSCRLSHLAVICAARACQISNGSCFSYPLTSRSPPDGHNPGYSETGLRGLRIDHSGRPKSPLWQGVHARQTSRGLSSSGNTWCEHDNLATTFHADHWPSNP